MPRPYQTLQQRNKDRKNNYKKGTKFAFSGKRRYTAGELFLIKYSQTTDRQLAKDIKRSVQAIQVARVKIKAGYYFEKYGI